MVDLLFYLLLGHFFGDFALQTDRVAAEKQRSLKVLTYHVTLYSLVLMVFLYAGLLLNGQNTFLSITTIWVVVGVFIAHWIQDYLKAFKFNGAKQAFYLDQAMHVFILFVIRIFVYNG